MEMDRCMMFEKKMPKMFWAEAVATSIYLLNRLAIKAVEGQTLVEAWSGFKLLVKYFHIPTVKRTKLDEKDVKGVFISYATKSKGYKIYKLNERKVVIAKDVYIDEKVSWDWDENEVEVSNVFVPSLIQEVRGNRAPNVIDTTDGPILRTKSLLDV